MKRMTLYMLLTLLVAHSAAAAEIITVSKFQYGKQWAFTKEEVQLLCHKDGSLYALNLSTLMQYPLNEVANAQMRAGQVKAQPIDTILLDDPATPGQKMSIAPFAQRASQLCKQ